MKKGKHHSSFTTIGSPSLLVVFLVLCLATFAILSLSGAKSDYTFTERLARHKSDYYAAAAQAGSILGGIDDCLAETWQSREMTKDEYLDALAPVLSTYDAAPLSYSQEGGTPVVSYQVPIDDKQSLFVELKVTDPTESPNYYEIQLWQVASSGTWESDGTLNLMSPQ